MTLQENDIMTTHHLADAWGVGRSVAVKKGQDAGDSPLGHDRGGNDDLPR